MVQRSLYLVVATATCVAVSNAFVPTPSQQSGSLTSATHRIGSPKKVLMETSSQLSVGSLIDNLFSNPKSPVAKAKELVQSLVEDEKCFATEAGAVAFGNACADDVVYEDCFEPKPFVGKSEVTGHILSKVAARKGRGDVRLDRITDGNKACGFAWTWTSGDEEGLRGTTFVELNDNGKIQYVFEIPEPLFKPGDLTLELLRAVTKGAEAKPKSSYQKRNPTKANELAKYLFMEVQGDIDESMRLFGDNIVYRDFNYDEPLRGTEEVRQFSIDYSFPGIEFKPVKFDDGIDSTCFTWDVCLEGQEEAVRGMSFYELDPETRKISYVRDVPEPTTKPPPLGKLARTLRPGLGVFRGVPIGSRPGGM